MKKEKIQNRIQWIDMANPTAQNLDELEKKFGLHPMVIRELQTESVRPRVENFESYIYIVYQFPTYDSQEMFSRRDEIDFIITKNELITIHYKNSPALNEFKKMLEQKDFEKKTMAHTLELSYQLFRHLLNFNRRQLTHINEKIENIASELFNGQEKKLLKDISYLKRDISEHRLIVHSQEHTLRALSEIGPKFWGEESKIYFEDLVGEYLKLLDQIESYREIINDFSTTNSQLLDVKTNEVMKIFTILAFITFPLVLAASLLVIRAPGTPFVDMPNGFWIIVGLMAAAIAVMFLYFKTRDWL